MRKSTATALSVIALAAWLTATVTVAAPPRNFRTHLSGDEETPAVVTLAQGQAEFQLSGDGLSLSYKLIVANIENVRAAHIHTAPAGTAGPVVVGLYLGPTIPGRTDGTLAEGVITASNLTGPLAGHPLSDLIAIIDAGGAYVNVHTDQHPGGEIRGQIR